MRDQWNRLGGAQAVVALGDRLWCNMALASGRVRSKGAANRSNLVKLLDVLRIDVSSVASVAARNERVGILQAPHTVGIGALLFKAACSPKSNVCLGEDAVAQIRKHAQQSALSLPHRRVEQECGVARGIRLRAKRLKRRRSLLAVLAHERLVHDRLQLLVIAETNHARQAAKRDVVGRLAVPAVEVVVGARCHVPEQAPPYHADLIDQQGQCVLVLEARVIKLRAVFDWRGVRRVARKIERPIRSHTTRCPCSSCGRQ